MNRRRSRLARLARLPFYFKTAEKLLRLFTVNSEANSFVGRIPPKHIDYRRPAWRNIGLNGINFRLDISDLVGWYTYWGFTDAPRRRLYSLMKDGDCFVDIGANLGDVSLNAAKRVQSHGHVFAFEPFPVSFDLLAENVEMNAFKNITLLNKGVGSENQILKMVVADEGNRGMNRMIEDPTSDSINATEVEVIKLDDFIEQAGLEKIDLIKIDVEGFEMNVLRGATATLKSYRPKLFTEVIDGLLRCQGSSTYEVLQFLESLDYDLSYAESGIPIALDRDFTNTQFDLVALPKENRSIA